MDRTYSSGAAGSAPSAPASPSSGYPTAGNPGTGTPATKPGPYWYHMIMEELMAIITAAAITPAQGTLNQLLTALRSAGVFTTQANTDDSTKVATTGWVRAAMSNIATAAGFACSIAINGYCKFPSWLGGWIIQWGSTAGIASGSNATVTFPITWPTGLLQAVTTFGSSGNLGSNTTGAIGSITTTTMVIYNFGSNVSYSWIAVGR